VSGRRADSPYEMSACTTVRPARWQDRIEQEVFHFRVLVGQLAHLVPADPPTPPRHGWGAAVATQQGRRPGARRCTAVASRSVSGTVRQARSPKGRRLSRPGRKPSTGPNAGSSSLRSRQATPGCAIGWTSTSGPKRSEISAYAARGPGRRRRQAVRHRGRSGAGSRGRHPSPPPDSPAPRRRQRGAFRCRPAGGQYGYAVCASSDDAGPAAPTTAPPPQYPHRTVRVPLRTGHAATARTGPRGTVPVRLLH